MARAGHWRLYPLYATEQWLSFLSTAKVGLDRVSLSISFPFPFLAYSTPTSRSFITTTDWHSLLSKLSRKQGLFKGYQ